MNEQEALWSAPENWKWGTIYYCAEDPRVMVPKRLRWTGWTLNFAHSWAWPSLAAILIVALGPTLLLLSSGPPNPARVFLGVAISLVLVVPLTVFFLRVGQPGASD